MASGDLLSGGREKLLSKAEAGYVDYSPGCPRPCFMCMCFDPHMLTCTTVAGSVLPLGTCKHAAAPVPAAPPEPPEEADNVLPWPLWGGKSW